MGRERRRERRHHPISMELDLTSMMNLVMVLIPCLLISIGFLKVTKIEALLAHDGTGSSDDSHTLGLELSLTSDGYSIRANGIEAIAALQALTGSDGDLFIPITTKNVSCGHYLGTWPPPRQLNRFSEACRDPTENKVFRVYDHAKLTEVLYEIKKSYPSENRITITAAQDVEFEAITHAMDASRSGVIGSHRTGSLFPAVVLEPCDL
ncbi:MAG: biopolymer transporter ExbD [Myxococcota bacterium]|nr:biopolymer transporter ExbD [Myxococcota bacterium]